MTLEYQSGAANRWLEPLLAAVVVAGVIYALVHLYQFGYLPQPFFYEPFDIWADWFNTSYWARDLGTYDNWRSIYPPLSFVFLRIFGLEHCYQIKSGLDASSGLMARGCDWLGHASLHGFYLLNVVLIFITFRKFDRRTAIWRTIALAAGLPMLDGLERGNLIIVSFTCLLLAFGPLIKSARLRWLAIGLAVNFKVYLIAAIFPLLLRRRWRWVEGALISVVLVYLVSFALLGRGTPFEIYDNIVNFSDQLGAAQLLDLWYATTYTALLSLLQGDTFPIVDIIGSRNVDILLIVVPLIQRIVQATIVIAAIAVWLRPETIPTYRVINLGLMLALITAESGGYTQAYFMLFVFMEPWRGFGRKWAIIACYILALPIDIPMDQSLPIVRDTYVGGKTAIVTYYIMLGPFFRPLIVLTVPFALALVTIRQVWIDVRARGLDQRHFPVRALASRAY